MKKQYAVIERVNTVSHKNNFNFLRLLFACLVLVSHAPEMRDGNRSRELLTCVFNTISFGELSVDGFFVLSGFLILSSWNSKPDFSNFLNKRVRRILPGYLAAYFLSVFFLAPLAVPDIVRYFLHLDYRVILSFAVQLLPPPVPNLFPGRPYSGINNSMWSISYEFRCYIIIALTGMCKFSIKYQKIIWFFFFITSLILLHMPQQVNNFFFPGMNFIIGDMELFVRVFSFFCAGACFALFQNNIKLKGTWAMIAILMLFVFMSYTNIIANTALATLGVYILFWFVFSNISLLTPFQKTDDISYGIYLYGWPIQKLLDWYFPAISPFLLLFVALPLSGFAGYMSWNFVESRFLRKRNHGLTQLAVKST